MPWAARAAPDRLGQPCGPECIDPVRGERQERALGKLLAPARLKDDDGPARVPEQDGECQPGLAGADDRDRQAGDSSTHGCLPETEDPDANKDRRDADRYQREAQPYG